MNQPLDAAIEVVKPTLQRGDDRERLVAAKITGLMRGYHVRYRNAPYRVDSVESVMTSDLFNPETNRKSRTFVSAGKLDVRVTEIATGRKALIDHKSTSDSITDLNAPYWRILQLDGQVSMYMLLEWLHENKVDFAVWDVMRKPGIGPKGLSKAEAGKLKEHRRYFGYDLTEEDCAAFDHEQRETEMMYAARLAHDCTNERPDWYFQRRNVPRLDSEILEYAAELWGHGQDIIATRASGRHMRNPGACMVYNSPCEYLGICSGHDTPDSPNWHKREWVHPELPIIGQTAAPGGIQTRGIEVLTNSRVRTFQTCRRKHFYRYEIGLERVDDETREALYFGDLLHQALEQYFLELQKQQRKGVAA